eukprot:TRINITY_DN7726_c0_g1_i5.p1 TRINITY_DN7726_c0_g1~~TRINITY_DN7726_c0_g1_i5.p1  ORF type:complete len:555 (-),score=72.16 TRINITY_DN7726_c0_g1_i5:45-1652(-)
MGGCSSCTLKDDKGQELDLTYGPSTVQTGGSCSANCPCQAGDSEDPFASPRCSRYETEWEQPFSEHSEEKRFPASASFASAQRSVPERVPSPCITATAANPPALFQSPSKPNAAANTERQTSSLFGALLSPTTDTTLATPRTQLASPCARETSPMRWDATAEGAASLKEDEFMALGLRGSLQSAKRMPCASTGNACLVRPALVPRSGAASVRTPSANSVTRSPQAGALRNARLPPSPSGLQSAICVKGTPPATPRRSSVACVLKFGSEKALLSSVQENVSEVATQRQLQWHLRPSVGTWLAVRREAASVLEPQPVTSAHSRAVLPSASGPEPQLVTSATSWAVLPSVGTWLQMAPSTLPQPSCISDGTSSDLDEWVIVPSKAKLCVARATCKVSSSGKMFDTSVDMHSREVREFRKFPVENDATEIQEVAANRCNSSEASTGKKKKRSEANVGRQLPSKTEPRADKQAIADAGSGDAENDATWDTSVDALAKAKHLAAIRASRSSVMWFRLQTPPEVTALLDGLIEAEELEQTAG